MAAGGRHRERLYLRVIAGPDEGKGAWLGGEPCLVGRSEDAGLALTDPEAGFEHAVVGMQAGKAWAENLSAQGTQVGGQLITERVTVSVGAVIGVGPVTRLRVEAPEHAPRSTAWIVPVCVLVLAAVGTGMLIARLRPKVAPEPPVKREHWQNAYVRIEDRMTLWEHKGLISADMLELFRQAWTREQAGDTIKALALWRQVQSLMLTTHVPGAMERGQTFASHAADTPKCLQVAMEWDPYEQPDGFQWTTDEALADAAWWFVSLRVQWLRSETENE